MDSAQEQTSGPYAPPRARVDSGGISTSRNAWVAVALAVLSPVYPMLYVARGWRALGYLAALLGANVLAIGLATFLGVPLNLGGSLGAVALRIVGAIDGYRRARAWPGSAPLPWYARWPGLASIMALVILGVLCLRAFIVEPFRIPSGAMIPTLVVGDYILVSKSAYGVRLPRSGRRIVALGEPKRGDVAVFRYPEKPEIDYIKRVVGLPGDRVAYIKKQLSINGQVVPLTPAADYQFSESRLSDLTTKQFREDLDGHQHAILINHESPPVQLASVRQFPHREACEYSEDGFVCTVPAGHYFMMGDNRDSSSDSRYWGFVPDANLLGRAFLIWCSEGQPTRLGLTVE